MADVSRSKAPPIRQPEPEGRQDDNLSALSYPRQAIRIEIPRRQSEMIFQVRPFDDGLAACL